MSARSNSDSDEEFMPRRRQSRMNDSGSESGSDSDEFVPIRAHRTRGGKDVVTDLAGQMSSSKDTNTTEQVEKATSIISDKEKLKIVISEISKEKNGLQDAYNSVEGDSNLKRKALRAAHNPKIRDQVNSISRKEKLKLQKQFQRAQNAATLPNMNGEGYKAVTINISGKYKPATIYGPDFLESDTYSGWTTLPVKDNIYLIFNPDFNGINKHITKLVGQKVGDNHVLYKMTDGTQLTNLSLDEFTGLFPGKKINMKTPVKTAPPVKTVPTGRRTSRRGRN